METRNKILIFIFAFVFVLLLSDVSAIRINEVELNPAGGSAEKEWIELYNEDSNEIDISNWTLYDGLSSPSKIYNFSENTKIGSKEFYIVEMNRKLNNEGDFVTLYDSSNNKINETPLLKEKTNSSKTYQFCSSSWKFVSSTKGSENNCVSEETQSPSESETEEPVNASRETGNAAENTEPNEYLYNPPKKTQTITLTPIALNIKSEENKEILKKNLALAGIITFCIGFGALFFLKATRRRRENEFR